MRHGRVIALLILNQQKSTCGHVEKLWTKLFDRMRHRVISPSFFSSFNLPLFAIISNFAGIWHRELVGVGGISLLLSAEMVDGDGGVELAVREVQRNDIHLKRNERYERFERHQRDASDTSERYERYEERDTSDANNIRAIRTRCERASRMVVVRPLLLWDLELRFVRCYIPMNQLCFGSTIALLWEIRKLDCGGGHQYNNYRAISVGATSLFVRLTNTFVGLWFASGGAYSNVFGSTSSTIVLSSNAVGCVGRLGLGLWLRSALVWLWRVQRWFVPS